MSRINERLRSATVPDPNRDSFLPQAEVEVPKEPSRISQWWLGADWADRVLVLSSLGLAVVIFCGLVAIWLPEGVLAENFGNTAGLFTIPTVAGYIVGGLMKSVI